MNKNDDELYNGERQVSWFFRVLIYVLFVILLWAPVSGIMLLLKHTY
jgi:hypothetical protein